MAFVNEHVSAQDKSNVLFTKNNPFPPNEKYKLRPFKWTIDRENDFMLMAVGLNNPEMWDRFVFQWMGELGALMAVPDVVKVPLADDPEQFSLDVTWAMKVLHVPVLCADKAEEIKKLLTDAFETYGRRGGVGRVHSVRVIWDECGVIVGGGYGIRE